MYILFLFTLISSASAYQTSNTSDWRAISEFTSQEKCERAVKEMGIRPERVRCLPK